MKENTLYSSSEQLGLEPATLDDLPAYFDSQGIVRLYTARNKAYKFNILDDTWQVGTKSYIYLDWMREANMPVQAFVALRTAMAMQASALGYSSCISRFSNLKKFSQAIHAPLAFQEIFNTLTGDMKKSVKYFFNSIQNDVTSKSKNERRYFEDIITFLGTQEIEVSKKGQNIFHPQKGAYSEQEENEINEKLRLKIDSTLRHFQAQTIPDSRHVHQLSTLIATVFLKTIFRRPTQLVQLKWCDVLPVGMSFSDHRQVSKNEIVEDEHLFSDIDQLHIRTFKGKDGEFRQQAERRSHLIEPDFSQLILRYRQYYQQCFINNLLQQTIVLDEAEINDLLFRCPLFPPQEIFSFNFETKEKLFKAIGYQSDALHKTSGVLKSNIRILSASLKLKSERIDNLAISNNRSRHTVLTNGSRANLSSAQLCAITGVTEQAVVPYLDLDMRSRVLIDDGLAQQKVFQQFSKISVANLQQQEGFKVLNEFDEEQGIINKKEDCTTCEAKLGVPLGCYGCNNFRPHVDADHRANLRKAERKLAFNQQSGHSMTLERISRAILYIRATIAICDDIKLSEKGLKHAAD